MKYGIWNTALPDSAAVDALQQAGYSPLTARVLAGRGCKSGADAGAMLDASAPWVDPFRLKEMDRAVAAIRQALQLEQKIAVFGDYDVDGITATCLLTDYLRSVGADCIVHIPGRMEEGYGLNAGAIRQLHRQGVRLIVTVDCGITAVEEAELCRTLGVTLVITDHHECKDRLPRCAAVVDPHRPDRTYPHTTLSGVGIAFKLAAALSGDQEEIAARYCDLICLGTIADVMTLQGENRRLVVMGLEALRHPRRLGLRALIDACDCDSRAITAGTIGYVLAPRINAAGRMEQAELAVRLFLTQDPQEAAHLADTLCRLNRERQAIESEIYREAVSRLQGEQAGAIVLAGEHWHQGVVGIVASRLSEEYCRPTFLICLDGDRGKASSRSYGGFNLFASLSELSELLEGYGGHELAAGFTIARSNIDAFRRSICRRAEAYAASGQPAALQIDCEIEAALLTEENVEGLAQLEPCGAGCPKPVFRLSGATVDRATAVGGGKHLRIRLLAPDGAPMQAIFFSAGTLAPKLQPGRLVDLAFTPQINEFRNLRTVQLNLVDLQLVTPTALYDRYCRCGCLEPAEAVVLAPDREDVIYVWNYLRRKAPNGRVLRDEANRLCADIAAVAQRPYSARRAIVCLEILSELGLVSLKREGAALSVRIIPHPPNPLENSVLFCTLRKLKAGD